MGVLKFLYEAVVMAVTVVKTEPAVGSEGSFSSSHLQNSRSLSDTLAAEFQRCLADQTFVDVRLYGGLSESVRCHKVVLAAFSGLRITTSSYRRSWRQRTRRR